jgi:myo-inositol-1(or 4)-monophosphatase
VGADEAGTSGRTWVIDPVDGTYNFFHGLTWWCSAIALQNGDDAVLGAVFHPHDDVIWVGGPDLSTTRNGVPVPPLADLALGEVCAATYLHPPYFSQPRVHEPFRRVVARAAAMRMLGSGSMDLSAVADGRLGLWFQHSVPAWDWLPGKALVEGAGGVARQVVVEGVTWSVAGGVRAVEEAVAALTGA